MVTFHLGNLMFAFLPPAKAARTERSPLGSTELGCDVSQLTTPSVTAVSPFPVGQVRPVTIAEADIRVGGVSVRPSIFLSGIGTNSCWMVDENTRLLRVWDMRKPFWHRTAPRVAHIPFFTESEGLPLFVTELGPNDESIAFCTDYGVVSSLDHSVEFQVSTENEPVKVSAFACRREQQATLTAVGTLSGAIFVAIKIDGERFVISFERTSCNVSVRTSTSSSGGSWWSSFLPKRLLSTGSRESNNDEADGNRLEFTLLRFRGEHPTQLWAVNAASEFFLLDIGPLRRRRPKNNSSAEGGIRAKWITNISSVLQRRGRVVAFDETPLSLCCLVYLFSCSRWDASLEVVTMEPSTGAVRRVVSMQSIALLAHSVASAPLHHTKIYLDESSHMITILSGQCCVFLNNDLGVRNPCSSEDVHMLRNVEFPIVSALLPDGHIVTMGINGPVVSNTRADELLHEAAEDSREAADDRGSRGSGIRQNSDAWKQSRFTGGRDGLNDVTRLLNNLLDSLRIDCKMSIDSAVLDAGEAICLYSTPHKGNWARADLNIEDDNIIMHVTHSVVQRQQEHRRFLLTVLLHKEIALRLQPQTIARLLSMQEALLVMVAIRRLQNDTTHCSSSATTTVEGFEVMTPLYQLASAGSNNINSSLLAANLSQNGDSCSVEDYRRLVRSAVERERCQLLLRRAINCVADQARSDLSSANSMCAQATSAEIVFGDPSRLSQLLQVLCDNLHETQDSVLIDRRSKFDDALSVASVFVLVARAIDESREDIERLCPIPQNVRALMWTSSDASDYGIQLHLSSAAKCFSDALAGSLMWSKSEMETMSAPADPLSEKMNTSELSSWLVPVQDQLRLLDFIAVIIHFTFRNHSEGGPTFFASAMRSTLFREPFLIEPLGYPFGAPVPTETTVGACVLRLCEELALDFVVDDVVSAFCLAEPVENPLQPSGKYDRLGLYCERNPKIFEVALRTLLTQRREWELQLLPELLPQYEAGAVARDEFLAKEAPQLLWLMRPQAFYSLVEEGARLPSSSSASYFLYGDDLVTHRSRCLALSRLAWVASGSGNSSSYYGLELDTAVVAAQKRFLMPDTKNVVLGPAELVQRLLQLPSPDAWMSATGVACLVEEELRKDLLTQIARRAKQHDGEVLLQIKREGTSELEVARALEVTAIGRILLAATGRGEGCATAAAKACAGIFDNAEQQLLTSWLRARSAGLVS